MAIPLGLLSGYVFAGVLVAAFNTELYRFPLVVSVAHVRLCGVLPCSSRPRSSGLAVRRQLDHLDLVAVLKTRE